MGYYERVGNLHIHTTCSDGTSTHAEIAAIAARAGLDYLIVTDHNVYVPQHAGWYGDTLLLVGEEVHNPAHEDVNHYLVFNARDEMAPYGANPQRLIGEVRARGGLGFIAHPYEHSPALTHEPEIDWVDWGVRDYQGLEIWNYMSESKSHLTNWPLALLYAWFPKLAIRGPFPETLRKWDELLARRKVVAVGGSDAHATTYRMGPLKRQVFSYAHLFRALNTHILVPQLWSKEIAQDARLVYDALAHGKAFVAYDGLASARGFSFTAEYGGEVYTLGDEFTAGGTVRFHVHTPARARLRLIQNGFCVAEAIDTDLTFTSRAPGAYRVEAHRFFLPKQRGWIFSNPILIRTQRRQAAQGPFGGG
jgi:hypothetical protein